LEDEPKKGTSPATIKADHKLQSAKSKGTPKSKGTVQKLPIDRDINTYRGELAATEERQPALASIRKVTNL
jgi:hypothetical protein